MSDSESNGDRDAMVKSLLEQTRALKESHNEMLAVLLAIIARDGAITVAFEELDRVCERAGALVGNPTEVDGVRCLVFEIVPPAETEKH